MNRYAFFPITIAAVVFLSGCAAKPENVVKLYINRMCAYDIAGAKKLCTGAARDELGNLQETLEVQRVLAVGGDIPTDTAESSASQMKANMKITLDKKTDNSALVFVTTEEEQVIFRLTKVRGKWLISGITNPTIGILKK